MKNVLFLAEQLRVGGAETYFYKLENNINRDNINFYTAACMGPCLDKIKYKEHFYELTDGIIEKFKQISKIIIDREVEIVHANSLRLCLITALIKKLKKVNIRIYYTKHNITFLEKISDKVFAAFVNRNVEKLLTVCETDKNIMMTKGIRESKICVIPNGTDLDQFRFNSRFLRNNGKLNIGIVARLSEEKNHMFFIDVIENLQKNTEVKFDAFIIGDGPLNNEIRQRIDAKKLKIQMLGNVENPQSVLEDIDIKILVSKREVFPMTILEAMSVGSLVVSIDVGGVKDCVVSNKTGHLVKNYDVGEFTEIIEYIYYNRDKQNEIIYNARNLVEEKFSMKSMINSITELYVGE